jgi:hypothetical protein
MAKLLNDDLAKVLLKPAHLLVPIRTVELSDRNSHNVAGTHSVVDVIMNVSGQCSETAGLTAHLLGSTYPGIQLNIAYYQFEHGLEFSTVAKIATIVEIIMLLPCSITAATRRKCADVCVLHLYGDMQLVDEVLELPHVKDFLAREKSDKSGKSGNSDNSGNSGGLDVEKKETVSDDILHAEANLILVMHIGG